MSDTIFKIFPRYYYPKYTDEQIISAVKVLKSVSSEIITFTNYKCVKFISCGKGLEQIFCQWCGRKLEVDLWQEVMSNAYEISFEYLGFRTPCCNLPSSLEELIYVKPCGFATFVIEVHNPAIIPCTQDLNEMGKCFGNVNFFRMISTHI